MPQLAKNCKVASSQQNSAGRMLKKIGKWSVGAGHRNSVAMHRMSFKTQKTVWML